MHDGIEFFWLACGALVITVTATVVLSTAHSDELFIWTPYFVTSIE
jgi:hypothetical protein